MNPLRPLAQALESLIETKSSSVRPLLPPASSGPQFSPPSLPWAFELNGWTLRGELTHKLHTFCASRGMKFASRSCACCFPIPVLSGVGTELWVFPTLSNEFFSVVNFSQISNPQGSSLQHSSGNSRQRGVRKLESSGACSSPSSSTDSESLGMAFMSSHPTLVDSPTTRVFSGGNPNPARSPRRAAGH